ncbi:class I SAM-dependent methyltransferase [Methanocella sp. CWC-04]|uniref:Class I SAM-dependent methyltransferase n=1 Tax=Methanooceanicella nereidis TaxID=2052831 RepID=A0AAP2RH63_9EURY|nr:class I SAM-dependent methyltransferase [Methanocella sp. CWC-04]MCD1296125.1 class I SAM-dependent methyltransferase [Methanocella sp. CWC-04]
MSDRHRIHEFYSGIADRYDLLMPWDNRRKKEEGFFKKILSENNVRSVLDCHCGTGFHLVMLSSMGYDTDGVDLSPDMIAMATKNLRKHGMSCYIYNLDIKEISSVIEKRYDCVISMGNSLPHEFGDENLYCAIRNMYDVLKPGGLCILHLENFDALYRDRERFIPSLYTRDGECVDVFIFAIDYHKDSVVFNILSIIERKGKPEFNVDVVEYNPVSPGKVRELMEKAGFKGLRFYENFNMDIMGTSDSYDLIVTAKK